MCSQHVICRVTVQFSSWQPQTLDFRPGHPADLVGFSLTALPFNTMAVNGVIAADDDEFWLFGYGYVPSPSLRAKSSYEWI